MKARPLLAPTSTVFTAQALDTGLALVMGVLCLLPAFTALGLEPVALLSRARPSFWWGAGGIALLGNVSLRFLLIEAMGRSPGALLCGLGLPDGLPTWRARLGHAVEASFAVLPLLWLLDALLRQMGLPLGLPYVFRYTQHRVYPNNP